MNKLVKAIYTHLITKPKYNSLKLKYDIKCEDLQKAQVELNTTRMIYKKKEEIWNKVLKEQEEEIIKLKKRKVKSNGKIKNEI